jgi:PIG-X / PBN1
VVGRGLHGVARYQGVLEAPAGGQRSRLSAEGPVLGRQLERIACEIALVQQLPATIFADVYELERLGRLRRLTAVDGLGRLRQSTAYTVDSYGRIELEKLASDCAETVVVLRWNASASKIRPSAGSLSTERPQPLGSEADSGTTRAVVDIDVPLHAHYPVPTSRRLSVASPEDELQVAAPTFLIRCCSYCAWHIAGTLRDGQGGKGTPGNAFSVVAWDLPRGNVDHIGLATWATGIAGICVTLLTVFFL